MPSPMRHLCMCAGLIFALSTVDLSAQEKVPCFEVSRERGNLTEMGLGSILLNKCTGETWLLMLHKRGGEGSAIRWFPITAEKSEAAFPAPQPATQAAPTRR